MMEEEQEQQVEKALVEEFLKPRYVLTQEYPRCPHTVGYIYEGYEVTPQEIEEKFNKYPKNYRLLEWWEYRTMDVLIQVKFVRVEICRIL